MRSGWVPPIPRDCGALPTGIASSGRRRRFPAASPGPRSSNPSAGAPMTRHQQGFTCVHPSNLPPPVAPGWNRSPWACNLSFAPRRHKPTTHVRPGTDHRALARSCTFDFNQQSTSNGQLTHSCVLASQPALGLLRGLRHAPRASADIAPRRWPPPDRRARGASHVHHDPFDRVGNRLYRYSAVRRALAVSRRSPRPGSLAGRGACRRLGGRHRRCGRPMSARFGAICSVERLLPPDRFRFAFRSCLHARGRLAVPPGRHVVGTLDLWRAIPRLGRPQLLRAAATPRGRHSSRHG